MKTKTKAAARTVHTSTFQIVLKAMPRDFDFAVDVRTIKEREKIATIEFKWTTEGFKIHVQDIFEAGEISEWEIAAHVMLTMQNAHDTHHRGLTDGGMDISSVLLRGPLTFTMQTHYAWK